MILVPGTQLASVSEPGSVQASRGSNCCLRQPVQVSGNQSQACNVVAFHSFPGIGLAFERLLSTPWACSTRALNLSVRSLSMGELI